MFCRTRGFTVLVLTICFTLQFGRGQEPSRCALSGRITNSPATGIAVRLKPVEKNPLALYDGYSTRVASDGSFHFEDIVPGKYWVVAEGSDFVPSESGAAEPGQRGVPVELSAGQHRKGVEITLVRKRLVCGKVTDVQGLPIPQTEVDAYAHLKGTSWLTYDDPEGMRTVTDVSGRYQFDLDPGEYFIRAGMYTWFSGESDLTQVQAESLAYAEPVEVGPAGETQCRDDIHVGPRVGWMQRHIRGTIADDPARTGDLVLSLLEVSRTGAMRPYWDWLNPGRTFDITVAPPGRYRLTLSIGRFPQTWAGPPPDFHVLASQDITLAADADVNGIVLRADALTSLSGRVKMENLTPRTACPTEGKMRVSIQKDDDGQFQQMELGADGTFRFDQVAPGKYKVRLYPLLRGQTYVKSMVLDGSAVGGREVNLSAANSHTLEVVLSGDPAGAPGRLTPDDPAERYEEDWAHPKASVSGTVSHAISGNAPWVKLWAVRFNSDRSYEYSTKPAPDGTFRFDNVDPGIYLLLTQGEGYSISEYGAQYPGLEGTAIVLKAGQKLEKIKLTAAPKKPSLCGKVTAENGQALANMNIVAWRQTKWGGYRIPSDAVTDGAGNFQFLDLKSGRYFIWAESDAPPRESSGQQLTYFPSSPNLDGAQPIEVGFEPDLTCHHNIRMRGASAFHVRGKVPETLPHEVGEFFIVSLIETNAAGGEHWSHVQPGVEGGGAFDFANVRPGRYRLRLNGPYKPPNGPGIYSGPCGPPSPPVIASQEIVVVDRDRKDVAIDLNSLVSLSGEVQFEDIPKELTGFKVESQMISLSVENALCATRSGPLSSAGAFAMERLEGGMYRVDLGVRGPLYIKSMRLDGQWIEGAHITLTPKRTSKLSVVVSGKGGEVNAVVAPSEPPAEDYRYEEPCRSRMAVGPFTFLIPDRFPADGSGIITGARTQEGFFEMKGVAPGRYHAVAGDNFGLLGALSPFGESAWANPEFLRAVAMLGQSVEVAAGEKIKVRVRSATAEIQGLLAQQKQEVRIGDHCAASCSYDEFWTGNKTRPAQK